MKKFLLPLAALLALPAFAQDIQFDALTKKQIEDVTTEFQVNFSHTAVAAPETDGRWGVEVGLVAGQSGTPKLKDAVNDAGGDGKDFKSLYHAGLMARVHIPYDIFFEATHLPEREISEVEVAAQSFAVGWNLGSFFSLPLDIAIGANASNAELSFKQTFNTPVPNTQGKVTIDGSSRVYWVGVSKSFLFVTPYAKVGMASQESDIKATGGSIFAPGVTAGQKAKGKNDGSYMAAGLNLQLAFFKLGAEYSQTMDVKRVSGKLSFDF